MRGYGRKGKGKRNTFSGCNNKGQILDVVTLIGSILATIVILVVSIAVFTEFRAGIEATNLTTPEVNYSMNQMETHFGTFDKLIMPLFVIGLLVGLIITSFLIPSHPIFLVINIIGMFFLIFLGVAFRLVYSEITSIEPLATASSSLFFSPIIMQNLPFIGLVAVIIATIIGVSKRGEAG